MKKLLTSVMLATLIATTSVNAHRNCLSNLEDHFNDGFLSLYTCGITSQDMPKVIQFLKTHHVNGMNLAYNNLGDEGAKQLAANETLVGDWVDLTSNNIGAEGSLALAKSQHIRWLLLANNNISSEAVVLMSQNPGFQFLDLSYDNLNSASINALSKIKVGLRIGGYNHFSPTDLALVSLNKTRLDIIDEPISDESAKILGQNKTLNTVFLYNNQISPTGFKNLVESKSIEALYTFDNTVGLEGSAALAKNSTIKFLWIVNGKLGDEGAIKIAEASKLSYLLIAKDAIGDAAAKAFAKTSIRMLKLPANMIGTEGANALAADSNLYSLDLSENYSIGEKGITALMNNKTLKNLSIAQELGWEHSIDLNPDNALSSNNKEYLFIRHNFKIR